MGTTRTFTRRMAGGLALGGLLLAGPALAHHGWGSYDADKTTTVTGTVSKLAWGSPHVSIWLEHAGRPTEVVLAPPSRMETRGLSPDMVKEGATVSLDAYPRKDGAAEFRAERIRVGDKTVELR